MEITPFRDFAARLENENEQRMQAAMAETEEVKEGNEVARSESIRESI